MLENPDNLRDCRRMIVQSLAQRSSGNATWYKPIGVDAARRATDGLMNCREAVPRDVLRSLDLPPKGTWASVARILRSSIPQERDQESL
jgi:hypothetical protein